MRNYFEYLINEDAGDFFQKVAIDQAGVKANHVAPEAMAKIASAKSPFEKIAARLDRDLEHLQVAGECGTSGGMMKRANAYIDLLFSSVELSADEFGEVFDKVAAAAIQTDVLAAYDELCAGLPEDLHHIVDEVLIKVGQDMTEIALLEKEAIVGALRSVARGVGGALSGAPGRIGATVRAGVAGAGAVTKQVVGRGAKEVATAVKAPFQAAGRAGKNMVEQYRAGRAKAIMDAPNMISRKLSVAESAASAPGIKGTVAKAQAASLKNQLAKADTKRTAHMARTTKNPVRAQVPDEPSIPSQKRGKAPPKAERADDAADTADVPSSADGGRSKPPTPKAKDADGPDSPRSSGGDSTPAPPGGADGKPPGFMSAWKKATTDGWKALSNEERGALIRGGVTAALVYRAATGKGAVTGGEGAV